MWLEDCYSLFVLLISGQEEYHGSKFSHANSRERISNSRDRVEEFDKSRCAKSKMVNSYVLAALRKIPWGGLSWSHVYVSLAPCTLSVVRMLSLHLSDFHPQLGEGEEVLLWRTLCMKAIEVLSCPRCTISQKKDLLTFPRAAKGMQTSASWWNEQACSDAFKTFSNVWVRQEPGVVAGINRNIISMTLAREYLTALIEHARRYQAPSFLTAQPLLQITSWTYEEGDNHRITSGV
jgi:hypothetical protein